MKYLSCTLFTIFICVIAHAQLLTGNVYDENNNPLEYVNIRIKGTRKGAVTDVNGKFVFKNIEQGHYDLQVTFLGYKSKTINIEIPQKSEIIIQLETQSLITEEVVISAVAKIEPNIFNIPVRIQSISATDIQTLPAIRVNHLFEGISGVNVNSAFGMFSSSVITLRGLSGNSQSGTLVLLDGSPINKSDAGSVNWNMIDKDNISSIEVIKGPGSVVYGANAMGGIINIKTKKPVKTFSGNLSASYGTYNTFDSKVMLSGRSPDNKFYWKSFNSYSKSDGYINTPEEIILLNDSIIVPVFFNEYMVKGLAGYNINNKNSAEISITYFNDTRGRGIQIYEDFGANTNRSTIYGNFKFNGELGNTKLFANIFLLQEDYFRLNEYFSDGEYALFEIDSRRKEQGGKIMAVNQLTPQIELLYGADLQIGSAKGADIYYTSTDLIQNKGILNIYSGFVQTRISLFDSKINLVPGIRFDHAIFDDAMFTIENPSYSIEYITLFQYDEIKKTSWNSFSPKISLEYIISEKLRFFAAFAKGFRPPRLDDLCRSSQVSRGFKVANPEIKPEYLYSYEIGSDIEFLKNVSASISVYYNTGKDFMYLLSTGDSVNLGYAIAPIFAVDNIGEVNIYGFETDLRYKIKTNINIFVNYTYNQSIITEFKVNPDGAGVDLTGKYLTNIPDHKFSTGLSWTLKYINVSAMHSYYGTRWIQEDNGFDEIYLLTDRYPAYSITNFKIWKDIYNFTLSLTIDNMFNNIYTNSRGYKCPGRMFIFEVKYDF